MSIKKIIAGAILVIGVVVTGLSASASLNTEDTSKNTSVAYVTDVAGKVFNKALGIEQSSAYQFNTASGLTIDQADVDTVGEDVGVGITSYLQILKFLGIVILVGVTSLIVNKIFSFVRIG